MKNINLKILRATFLLLLFHTAVLKSMPIDKQVALVGSSFISRDAAAKFSFNPDGTLLARVGSDGRISLLELSAGVERTALIGDINEKVTSLAFSPDSETLAFAVDGDVKLWNFELDIQRTISTGKPIVTNLVYSPGKKSLAWIEDRNRILVWDVSTDKKKWTQKAGNTTVTVIAFSPDGEILASGNSNGGITIRNSVTGKQLAFINNPSTAAITDLAFSAQGLLAATDAQAKLFLLDPARGYQQNLLKGGQEVGAFKFSVDGTILAGSTPDSRINLWYANQVQQSNSADNPYIKEAVIEPSNVVTGLVFNGDNGILATTDKDALIELWDVAKGELLHTLIGHWDRIAGLAFNNNHRTLASIGYDGQLIIWDLTEGRELFVNQVIATKANFPGQLNSNTGSATAEISETPVVTATTTQAEKQTKQEESVRRGHRNDDYIVEKPDNKERDGVIAISASFDGKMYSSVHKKGIIRVFDQAGVKVEEFEGHEGKEVTDVKFFNNGKRLVTVGRDSKILLWNLTKKKLIQTLQGPEHPIRAVAVSKKDIAVGGEETRIMIYDIKTGKLKEILSSHLLLDFVNTIAFSRDGKRLVSGDAQGRVLVWDIKTGKVLKTLLGHANEINAVIFGKNDKIVISGSEDKTVKVWDIDTRENIKTFAQHKQAIRSVKQTRNGKFVISAGEGGEVLKWNLSTGQLKKNLSQDLADVNALEVKANGNLLIGNAMGQIKELEIDEVN
jgi:WD40 repeat protein